MSNLDRSPQELPCGGGRLAADAEPVRELLFGHPVALGGSRGMTVTRTLPHRARRMVGAWCFVDVYGPDEIDGATGMQVPPHPHTGLQTVTWLIAGEVLHRDSIGSRQLVAPGAVNLMTAGRGISHSEQSPAERSPVLHGVQLWTALPDRDRDTEPHFEHHAELPVYTDGGLTVRVFLGELDGLTSPATAYSPLVGAEASLAPGTDAEIPLRPEWEHAVLVLFGTVEVDGTGLTPGPLLHLGPGRRALRLRTERAASLLLIGGEPFAEQLVMWWNFVGRDHAEIVAAREEWVRADRRFGTVPGYPGERLAAPPMPTTRLRPRGRTP